MIGGMGLDYHNSRIYQTRTQDLIPIRRYVAAVKSMRSRRLVGAVGIEITALLEIKEFCGAPWPSKSLKGKGGNP
jgi:hypothetical protein